MLPVLPYTKYVYVSCNITYHIAILLLDLEALYIKLAGQAGAVLQAVRYSMLPVSHTLLLKYYRT